MRKKQKKALTKMSFQELAETTRKYDLPGDPQFLVPSKEERSRHDKVVNAIRARRGRPKVGAGAKRIQVTMERQLLGRADAYAKRMGITRAQVIARGVETYLAKAG